MTSDLPCLLPALYLLVPTEPIFAAIVANSASAAVETPCAVMALATVFLPSLTDFKQPSKLWFMSSIASLFPAIAPVTVPSPILDISVVPNFLVLLFAKS